MEQGDSESSTDQLEKTTSPQKVRILQLEDSHMTRVLALYREIFGAEFTPAYKKRWRWSLLDNLAPDNSPAWVLAAGEEIVGFLSTIPQYYVIDGVEIIAHATADFMVHPKYRFHGVGLMKRFFKECENCVTVDDMAATIKVTTWLGAKQIGLMQRHVKVLDARSLRERPRFNRVPPSLLWPVTIGLRVVEKLRSFTVAAGVTIERSEQFDQEIESFYQQLSGSERAVVKRDDAFMRWRYGSGSPQSNRHIVKARFKDGRLAGYAIFSRGPESRHIGYIYDLQIAVDAGSSVAKALLKAAITDLRKSGAWTCRYHLIATPGSPIADALRYWGFSPRSGSRLLVKLQDPRLMAVAEQFENWNFVFGDSETSHSVL